MKQYQLHLVIALLASFHYGCVAPGSAIGRVYIEGSVITESNEPLVNRKIQFVLPAEYGLGGLDLVMNTPDDFGHKDEKHTARTDDKGDFQYDLGERVYHVSCWLLPPVGCYPKRPPPPFIYIRVDELPEYYAVQSYDGKFKTFSLDGSDMPPAELRLLELSAQSERGPNEDVRETVGVIRMKVKD